MMGKSKVFRDKNIRWSVFIIAVAGLVLWTAADIFAQGRGPCAEDAAKYCKDVQPGGGRMAECLKEHENELSAVCKEHFAHMGQRGREVHAACRDDARKLCRDVKPGEGRIARCLHEHREELSPGCRENMPERSRGR
jgi:cysteine rich repeat protein